MIKWLHIVLLYWYLLNVRGIEKYRNLNYQSVKSQLKYYVQCPLAESNNDQIRFYQQEDINKNNWRELKAIPGYPDAFELIISEVTDGSVYKCVVNTTDNKEKSAMIYIDKMKPDIRKLSYTIKDLQVRDVSLGSSLKLSCNITSTNNDDRYYWFSPDLWQLNTTSVVYTIDKMSKSNFGAYYCARYDRFDAKNKILSVKKIFVKLKNVDYTPDLGPQANSLTLMHPIYPLNEPVYFVPPQAHTLSHRIIWEQPPFNVLLDQPGRVFIKETMESELTKNEIFFRITDRNDPNVMINKAALFNTKEMNKKPFEIELTPKNIDIIQKSTIKLKCSNSEDRSITWSFIPVNENKAQALPNGTNTYVEGTRKINVLYIGTAYPYHSGIYICDGKRQRASAKVLVRPPPKLQITPNIITLSPYGTGSFLCSLTGASGKLIWRRKSSNNFRSGVEFVYGGDSQSVLKITRAPVDMNGTEYQCIFNNMNETSILLIHNLCSNKFRRCNNGKCIAENLFCDGKKDCTDGSDEVPSTCNLCQPNQVACKKYNNKPPTKRCITAAWVCDGEDDCGNRYDEKNCKDTDENTCLSTHFMCNDSNTVIPRIYWCDKDVNCPNKYDEINCLPPTVIRPNNPSQLIINKDSSISLACEVAGRPTATITWRYNWGRLPENLNYSIEVTGQNCSKIKNVLTIHKIHPKFAGIYTCEATARSRVIAPDYTLFVSNDPNCVAPYFNDNAYTKKSCYRCWCSNVTSTCTSARGYYLSPKPRISNPTTMNFMSYKSLKTLETTNFFKNYNKTTNSFIFTEKDFSQNPHVFIGSSFGFPSNWVTSYGFFMKIPIALTGLRSMQVTGPVVILQSTKPRTALYWCPISDYYHLFMTKNGYTNNLRIALTNLDSWYTDNQCSSKATRNDVMNTLIKVKQIMIRLKHYEKQTKMQLFPISLEYAIPVGNVIDSPSQVSVPQVEHCTCPFPYTGLSCETCVSGYERTKDNKCIVKCAVACDNCNNQGQCIKCKGNRSGPQCLQCKSGFYRMAGDKLNRDCVACPCNNGSQLTNNECTRDLRGSGAVMCKCSGNEVNDKTCDKCLQQPLPESLKPLCANQTKKSENTNCNTDGTSSIDNEICKCKDGYKGENCDSCNPGFFKVNSQCLKCFCSNLSSTCTGANYKFNKITLKTQDPMIKAELAIRKLTGLEKADMQSKYVVTNRTTNTITVKASPIDQGVIFLTLSVNQKDKMEYRGMSEYIRMYGGKLSFTFEYFVKSIDGLVYADVTPFLEISSLKLGRLWTPMKYNSNSRLLELTMSEYGASWNSDNKSEKKIDRELFMRYLMTADKLSVGFPFKDLSSQVKLRDIQMQIAAKDGNGDVAPIELCGNCPSTAVGSFCQTCNDPTKSVKVSLNPGYPDLVCGSCTKNCGGCPSGSYDYDFINNKKYKTCQIGIETGPKGRVIFANAGETLTIPSISKSYKGGTAVHKWEKLDKPGGKVIMTSDDLNTTRKLLDDGRSQLNLNFNKILVLDQGWYRARARNVYTKSEETFKIVVNPDAPPRVKTEMKKPVTNGDETTFKIKIKTADDKNAKITWKISKDGKTVKVPDNQLEVIRNSDGEYVVKVKVPSNSTGNYQLKAVITGTRPTNPFYYEIKKDIPKDTSTDPSQPTITVDKPDFKVKFMEAGKVTVKTGLKKKTVVKWFKLNPKTNEKEPLPNGMSSNTRKNGDHELAVFAATDDHNGKYIGIVTDPQNGKEIGKVTVKVSVSGMKPTTTHELKPQIGGDSSTTGGDSSTSGGGSSTSGGDSSTTGEDLSTSGRVKFIPGGGSSTSGGGSSTSGGGSSTSGGGSSTSGGGSSTSGGDSSTSGGGSSTSGGDSSTSGGGSSTSGGDSSTSGGGSSTSGGGSSTSGGGSSTSGGGSSTSGGGSSTSGSKKSEDGGISTSEEQMPTEDGTFNNMTIRGFIPGSKYCKNQTWYVVDKKSNTTVDITKYVERSSDNSTVINYPVKNGQIIQFKTTVIPEDDNKGVIEFKIDYKYPMIKIKPTFTNSSIFPTKLKCSDLNSDYPSSIKWYFKGKLVNKMLISDNGTTIDWTKSGKFDPKFHEGIYECRATNRINAAIKSVYIPNYKNPHKDNSKFPSKITISSSTHNVKTKDGQTTVDVGENEKLKLTASLDGNPNVTLANSTVITWTINNSTIVQPTESGKYYSTLVITDTKLKPNQTKLTYKVSIALKNGTEITNTIEVSVKPQEYRIIFYPNIKDGKLWILEGSKKTIRCALVDKKNNGNRKASIKWTVRNKFGGPILNKEQLEKLDIVTRKESIVFVSVTNKINDYMVKCQSTYKSKNYSSEPIKIDVSQEGAKPVIRLSGLTNDKYVEGIEGDSKQVICKALDSISNLELPKAQFSWKIEGSEKNWEVLTKEKNIIVFGGLKPQPINKSAQVYCVVKYFKTLLVSKKFTFRINSSSLTENYPKVKLQVIYDPKNPPYPSKVIVTDGNSKVPSVITVNTSNINFPEGIKQFENNTLVIDFTNNGSSEFNPYLHAGQYTFKIVNKYGYETKSITLPIYKNPNKNYPVKLVMYTEDMKEIKDNEIRVFEETKFKGICVFYGNPYPVKIELQYNKVKANRDIKLNHKDYWVSFEITNFKDAIHTGSYKCKAMTHQKEVIASVNLQGYYYGLKVTIVDKDNKPAVSRESSQGDNVDYRYKVYDRFTGKFVNTSDGIWQIKLNPKDPYSPLESVLKNTTIASDVDLSGNRLKLGEITRPAYLSLRVIVNNGTQNFTSEPIDISVGENKTLWPNLKLLVSNDQSSYPSRIEVLDMQKKIPSKINVTMVDVQNSKATEIKEDNKVILHWEDGQFKPFNDGGTYVFKATNKYGTTEITKKFPDLTKAQGKGYVKITVISNNTIRNKKGIMIILNSDDKNPTVKVICNYYNGTAPERIRFVKRSYKNIDSGPRELYVTSTIPKYNKTEDDGTYHCEARLRDEVTLYDAVNITGVEPGLTLAIKTSSSNDNGSTINMVLGSKMELKLVVTDKSTGKQLKDVKPTWIFTVLTNGKNVETTLADKLWKTNPDAALLQQMNEGMNGDLIINQVVKSKVIKVRCVVQKTIPGSAISTFSSPTYSLVEKTTHGKLPNIILKKQISIINGALLELTCMDEQQIESNVTLKPKFQNLSTKVKVTKGNNFATLKFPNTANDVGKFFGVYECLAESKFGKAKKQWKLEYEKPTKDNTMYLKSNDVKLITSGSNVKFTSQVDKRVEIDCINTYQDSAFKGIWVLVKPDGTELDLTKSKSPQFKAIQKREDIVTLIVEPRKLETNTYYCKMVGNNRKRITLIGQSVDNRLGIRLTIPELSNWTIKAIKRGDNFTWTCRVYDISRNSMEHDRFDISWELTISNTNKTVPLSNFASALKKNKNQLIIKSVSQGIGKQDLTVKCMAKNKTVTYKSYDYDIQIIDNENKTADIEFILVKNNPDSVFPNGLSCSSPNADSLQITFANGTSINSNLIQNRGSKVIISFESLKKSDYIHYEEYYRCKAANKYGIKYSKKLFVNYRNPMKVSLTVLKEKSYTSKDKVRIVYPRNNRPMTVDCYFGGEPKYERNVYMALLNSEMDIPPEPDFKVVNIDGISIEKTSLKRYRITFPNPPKQPVLLQCLIKGNGTAKSEIKIKSVEDVYIARIQIKNSNFNTLHAYERAEYKFTCKLFNRQMSKSIRILKTTWEFSIDGKVYDVNQLDLKTKQKDNYMILSHFKETKRPISIQCSAYSNSTYDTKSIATRIVYKVYPKIIDYTVAVEESGKYSKLIAPKLSYAYNGINNVEFKMSYRLIGEENKLKSTLYKCSDVNCKRLTALPGLRIYFEGGTSTYRDQGLYVHSFQYNNTELGFNTQFEKKFTLRIMRESAPVSNKIEKVKIKEKGDYNLECMDLLSMPMSQTTWKYVSRKTKEEWKLPPGHSIHKFSRGSYLMFKLASMKRGLDEGFFICELRNKFGYGQIKFVIE